jgi:putative glutathione S-transferase
MGDDGNSAYGHRPFRRSGSHFGDRITADGRDGWPVEAGRYRLVVSRACPWASRAVISRRLLGLEDALSLAVTDPVQDDRSWRFTLDPDGRDPVLGIGFLSEAYDKRETGHPGGVSVPAVVDVPSGRLVTNDYQRITLDLATEWTALHRAGAPDLYPAGRREEIDQVMAEVYEDVNNGVYRAGFATHQKEYEEACAGVFQRLELLGERLSRQRFLVGDTLTEADIRLFTTLVRFDAVYHGHFKCNRWKLAEPPGALGVRPGPVPDAGVRRHGRLRPHQAALLPGAHRHQPHRHRAARPGSRRVAESARPRGAGRPAVRYGDAARTGAAGRTSGPAGTARMRGV